MIGQKQSENHDKRSLIPPMTTKKTETYHKSVLVEEVLTYLHPQPNKTYVDATFGGGGHTRAILNAQPTCKVIALDWDPVAIKTNAPLLKEEFGDRVRVLWGNFIHIKTLLKKEGIEEVDGILADFGTSQHQIFEKEGFSFATNTPLDMRMSTAHFKVTAADVVNNYSEKDLADIIFYYGEDSKSRKIARAIVEARKKQKIQTTQQLVTIIETVSPRGHRPIHPATKTFQALRIEVNQELKNIQHFLKAAFNLLNPAGRLVCISFHSLEDRIVKNYFKEMQDFGAILTNKPIQATLEEIKQNPSSRSAKLRAIEKNLIKPSKNVDK